MSCISKISFPFIEGKGSNFCGGSGIKPHLALLWAYYWLNTQGSCLAVGLRGTIGGARG